MTHIIDSPSATRSKKVANPIRGLLKSVDAVTCSERQQMLSLLDESFENVTRDRFEGDLQQKDWVVLLRETATHKVRGFSTAVELSLARGKQRIRAIYSGDTVVDSRFRNESELMKTWGRHVFGLPIAGGEESIYWFLICSGYKTYRFLPLFFKDFYPTCDKNTPDRMQSLLNDLAHRKFPCEYDETNGIIRFESPTPVRPGVAPIEQRHLRDRHIAFFLSETLGILAVTIWHAFAS